MKIYSILILGGILSVFCSCSTPDPVPRPPGWPRIELPEHSYQKYDNEICPFTFDYPAFGVVSSQRTDSCVADLFFENFDCKWHLTYRSIMEGGKNRSEHFEEYRKLVYKHIQKVSQIQETELNTPYGNGVMYQLFGAVGVPAQFFFGDDQHLLMASFYFDEAIENDSLSPVIVFMKDDLNHLVESIRWR